jgi:hypothetical protein
MCRSSRFLERQTTDTEDICPPSTFAKVLDGAASTAPSNGNSI